MSENELGRSLLACDAPPNESRVLLDRLLERDRWRMRLWGGLTVFLWGLAASSVMFFVWFYFLFVQPKLAKLSADSDMLVSEHTSMLPDLTRNLVDIGDLTAQYIVGIAITTLLAAVSTVWLVFASRRATLRQLSEQLATISRQLGELRQAEAPRPPA